MKEIYLNVSAHVRFWDGATGTLHRLVIDPSTNRITDLVVVRGVLARDGHVIPVSAVEYVSSEQIDVGLSRQEWASYPAYAEIEYEQRVDDWEHEMFYPRERLLLWYPYVAIYEREQQVALVVHHMISQGIPTDDIVIGHSSEVHNIHGTLGKVDHLWINHDTWEVTRLVMHKGLFSPDVTIPFSWIRDVTLGKVFIAESDTEAGEMAATQVWQEGAPASTEESAGWEYLVDEEIILADEVAEELAEDPRVNPAQIEVINEHGVITLAGEVETEAAHRIAEAVAHRHEHVIAVVNALEVRAKPVVLFPAQSTLNLSIY